MKHLKKYESVNSELELSEVKEFCENHLAYLLDIGDLDIQHYHNDLHKTRDKYVIILDFSPDDNIKWEDIKDVYIPFLTMLNNKYEITNFVDFYIVRSVVDRFNSVVKNNHTFGIPKMDIINDEVESIKDYRDIEGLTFTGVVVGIIKK